MLNLLETYFSRFKTKKISDDTISFFIGSYLYPKFISKLQNNQELIIKIEKLCEPYKKSDFKYIENSKLFEVLSHQEIIVNLLKYPIDQKLKYDFEEVSDIFQNIINTDIPDHQDWSIRFGYKFQVDKYRKMIFIAKRSLTYQKLKSLIYHEIGIHMCRQLVPTASPKINREYSVFEEGLAKMIEITNSCNQKKPYFNLSPFLLILKQLGLASEDLITIITKLKYSQEYYQKKIVHAANPKYRPLFYYLGYQKVMYFSYWIETCDNKTLSLAFEKIVAILLKYSFDPLLINDIQRLQSNGYLNFTKDENKAYSKFLKHRLVSRLNNMQKGIIR